MRIALSLSILANILAVGIVLLLLHQMGGWAFVKAKYFEQVDGSPYSDPSRPFGESTLFRQSVSIHNLAPVREGDVVFLGDSHAALGQWSEFFDSQRVRNRGISGDNTVGVLRRLESVMTALPSAVFLFIGSNDVDQRYNSLTVDETVRNVERIVTEMKNRSPGTVVYLLSAPPKSRNTMIGVTETPLAHALNERYEAQASQFGATYVDIQGPLTDTGGALRVDFTEDGGHLNGAGYEAIVRTIRPLVEAALVQEELPGGGL